MTALTTTRVRCQIFNQDGQPDVGARIEFVLTATDFVPQGVVVPERVEVVCDDNGYAEARLWPNVGGFNGTWYRAKLTSGTTGKTTKFDVTVPVQAQIDLVTASTFPSPSAKPEGSVLIESVASAVTEARIAAEKAAASAVATGTDAAAAAAAAIAANTSKIGADSSVALAQTSANSAVAYAAKSQGSADAAAASAATADTKATAASGSATAAANSATTATTKAGEAANSATAAAGSASTATTKADAAAVSASSAAASATTATTKASEASTSATAAAGSASTASTKATEAAGSASSATIQANNAAADAATAAGKATDASNSAAAAASSATTVGTKATEAANSATAAANSATAAANSATAAANSATTASTKASEAASSATSAASSASQASTSASNAASNATAAANSATAAANSASSASSSASAAATSASNAATSEANTTNAITNRLSSTTPLMDGVAAAGNATDLARGDHTHPTDTSRAPVASPTFTGTPSGPTAALGTNTTQLATTAFVQSTTGGILNKSVAGGSNVTLTAAETGNAVLNLTGALTANIAVIVPTSPTNKWVVKNATTGAFTLTVKTASGTGVAVTQGDTAILFTDGTNVLAAYSDVLGSVLARDGAGSGLDADLLDGQHASYFAPLASPTFTGTPSGPTAAPGTNTTQLATTAFAQAMFDARTSAFIRTLLDDADQATARATLGAQASLGFTPVRQGGASGQDSGINLLLGWDGSVGAITAQAAALYLGRVLHQRTDVTVKNMNLNALTTNGVYQYEHANGANTGGPASQPGYGVFVVLNTGGFCCQILFAGATTSGGPETIFYRCWYIPNGTGSAVWKKLSFTEN